MWLTATGDSGRGIAPGCAAARSSSLPSLIPSFEDCSFDSSRVSRKCRRLRLYAVPCAVMMLYDLGALALFVTLARFHVFRVGVSTRTVCCVGRGASFLAVRSLYDLCPSCRCCINTITYPFWYDTAGRFDFVFLEKLARGYQVVIDWDCSETQHHQVRVAAFRRLCENLVQSLHCSLYDSFRTRIPL